MIVSGIENERGVRASIVLGDTSIEYIDIAQRFDFDALITSSPWVGYNNGSNGINGIDSSRWNPLVTAKTYLLSQANGINGFLGAFDTPYSMEERDETTLIDSLNSYGFEYRVLEALRSSHGNGKPYLWWLVWRGQKSKSQIQSGRKLYSYLEAQFQIISKPGSSAYFTTWRNYLEQFSEKYRPETPNRFVPLHVRAVIDAACSEGNTILDPFLGIGEIMPYAMSRNVNSVGVEIDADFYRATGATLREEVEHNAKSKIISTTRGTGRSRAAACKYPLSQEQARDQGLYTKKQLISMGIPESQWIPTNYELDREIGGRRPHLFRIKDFARDKEVETV